jgi:LmbE family N-acetylglucosaminyl deacetylase
MAWTDPRAVFFAPHPDDETLAMGVGVANHVAAGRQVHVVAVTGGGASGTRFSINGSDVAPWWGLAHNPAQEDYAPLDVEAFKTARRAEFRAACGALGVSPGNIHLYDLPDGGVTVADVEAIISADFNWPGASFKATSYRWSEHADHRACGQALKNRRTANPSVWGDSRWYVFSRAQWPTAEPDASTGYETPSSETVRRRVLNACRAYSGWMPRAGHFAIGYHNAGPTHFLPLESDVRVMVQTS